MSKLGRILVIMITCCLMLVHCSTLGRIPDYVPEDPIIMEPDPEPDEPEPGEVFYAPEWDNVRAVWVTTVFNLDFPSRPGLTASAIRREIEAIVSYSAQMGINTIFFQVRPNGDAFYESEIFPWSSYLSGVQGEGVPGIDPLEYFIEVAHAHNIELHAWINPYRIIHSAANTSDVETLAENHLVRWSPELTMPWTDRNGNAGLNLDPGIPEARQLILDSIEEIIRNYNVDGIHIDDYFYPDGTFDDSASFARYGGGMELGDWRRENVNILIRDIQRTIQELNDELDTSVRWGVSPTAIWMNDSTNPLGVPGTRGQESYHSLYADTRLWVTERWIDYIIPQIYWYIGFEIADFESVFNWWTELCSQYGVDLLIGLAAWREAEDHQSPRWQGEIVRQLELIEDSEAVSGSVFFRYNFLRGSLGNTIRNFYLEHEAISEREPVITYHTLSVGAPHQDMEIAVPVDSSPSFNIVGTSNPNVDLFVNGELVTNRTVEGFFSVFMPLGSGENVFTFTQEGQSDVTRVITRNAPAAGGDAPAAVTTSEPERDTFARVTGDAAWLFPNHTTSGGSDWLLSVGQVDRVLRESSNGFVQLSNGMWVNKEQVELSTTSVSENALSYGEYHVGVHYDMIVWQSDVFVGAYATFDGNELFIYFGLHTELPPLELPEDLSGTMITGVRSSDDEDEDDEDIIPFYAFAINRDALFEGHFIDFVDDEFRLHLKKRKTLSDSDRPMEGIIIVIDPGHGGESTGGRGPMGYILSEKNIALANAKSLAEELSSLGAEVHLTRETDEAVTIQERINLFKELRADLLISLHVNDVDFTTNSTNIHGFSVWYRNPNSIALSETMLDVLYYINPITNRHRNINQANFMLLQPSWAPSVILESGFIRSLNDFVWLIDPVQQARYTEAIVDAILDYFAAW